MLISPVTFWQPPSQNTESVKPLDIKLVPEGFSIEGMIVNLSKLPKYLSNHLRLILSIYFISKETRSDDQQSYFFKDMGDTTYKLFLSGVENLSSVIAQLQAGKCGTTDSDYIPEKLTQIEAYYDHGGTVPIYAATLSRDANGVTNETVHQCVSDLIKVAHDLWQKDATSGSTLGIIFGVIAGAAIVAGTAAYCFLRWRKNKRIIIEPEIDADTDASIPLKKI